MEERMYDIWAASIQNGYIGNIIDIVDSVGGAKELYNMKKQDMVQQANISIKLSEHIEKCQYEIDIIRMCDHMKRMGIKYVNHSDVEYPNRLRSISGRPYGLFYRGELPKEEKKSVAIIGARECTEYGRLMAEYFGDRLAREGIDIISGMAWGIDGVSQMAAVQAGGNSYAVLGCGVDVIYPAQNKRLYEMLIENGNGVISEYAPMTRAVNRLFPPRNRIISALSDVVIVVEARAKSGTLITVDMATEQGKSVMVVPGRITDPLSVGCLNLIREGAGVAIGVDSVLEELNNCKERKFIIEKQDKNVHKRYENQTVPLKKEKLQMADKESKLYACMSLDPISAEELAVRANISLAETLVMLTKLEMKKYIKEIASGYFVLNKSVN